MTRLLELQQQLADGAAIPAGWKLVPIEPTDNMVIDGFESKPDRVFDGDKYPEEFDDMSGCQQAAFIAKRCYAAMLAAAPTPPTDAPFEAIKHGDEAHSAQTDGCVIVDRAFLSGATNFLDASIELQQNSPEEPPGYRTQFDMQLDQLVDELRHILAAAPTPPEQVAQPSTSAAVLFIDPPDPETYEKPEHGWTCFHCGENFTTIGSARDHFGANQLAEPGCQIRVQLGEERGMLMAFRKIEAEIARYREEDTDLHREIYAIQSKHAQGLLREEENGYARGLRDAGYGEASTDVSKQLREYAGNPGYSHNDYSDTMRAAAGEIERYHGGMLNWKKTAEAKDAQIAELKRILDGIPRDAIDGGWTAKGICQYAKSLEDQVAALKQSQQDDARDAELEVGQDVRESLASMFGKDPVAWINKDRTYVEISTKATVYGSHTIPLYEAPKISGES